MPFGFIKVNNGFETKVYVGPVQGRGEKEDAEAIARTGTVVPPHALIQFLENDTYSQDYIPH